MTGRVTAGTGVVARSGEERLDHEVGVGQGRKVVDRELDDGQPRARAVREGSPQNQRGAP
jgi:hypothetical protein